MAKPTPTFTIEYVKYFSNNVPLLVATYPEDIKRYTFYIFSDGYGKRDIRQTAFTESDVAQIINSGFYSCILFRQSRMWSEWRESSCR